MSVFRPAARVTAPDGREWEVYAYRISLRPPRKLDKLTKPRRARLRRLADLVAAVVRSLRSDGWTIDAVTYVPHQTVYRWTTTREYKGQVLAQVQGHLQRGDVPIHLRNAVYRGELGN